TMSARDMIEALIAGERDPRRLAELARGKMRSKRAELVTALDGRFDHHHGELARLLLAQIDALSAQIDTLTAQIEDLIAELPEAAAVDHGGGEDTDITAPGADDRSDAGPQPARGAPEPTGGAPCRVDPAIEAECARLSAIERLDEITGIGELNAQVIIAEIGLDMTRFPTPAHLVSWAKLCPRTI
ncbi:MAG: transposase, partial [Mycobacterium sp.]